jgi:hypothetical protein
VVYWQLYQFEGTADPSRFHFYQQHVMVFIRDRYAPSQLATHPAHYILGRSAMHLKSVDHASRANNARVENFPALANAVVLFGSDQKTIFTQQAFFFLHLDLPT